MGSHDDDQFAADDERGEGSPAASDAPEDEPDDWVDEDDEVEDEDDEDGDHVDEIDSETEPEPARNGVPHEIGYLKRWASPFDLLLTLRESYESAWKHHLGRDDDPPEDVVTCDDGMSGPEVPGVPAPPPDRPVGWLPGDS